MADEKDKASDKPERQKMEVGGTGEATAKFKDSFEKDIKVKAVQWAISGSAAITPDEKDPSKAKFLATGPGPVTIRAVGEGEEGGHAEARIELMVLEKDAAAEGEITVSVQPAPAKPKQEPAKAPTAATPEHGAHVATATHR